MSKLFTVYPKVVPIEAVVAEVTETWVTKYGDEMTAEPGDMILSEGKKRWSVKRDIFDRTYRKLEDGRFTKAVPVVVEFAESDMVLETLEGSQKVKKGDPVVHGIDGERYSMSLERLRERYAVDAE